EQLPVYMRITQHLPSFPTRRSSDLVKTEVETVRVDVAVPPEGSVTLLGLTETVGQNRTRPDEEIDALRLAVPESPLRLVRVIPEELDEPHTMWSEAGEALMLKSPGGGGAVTMIVWDWVAVSPPESFACTTTG